MRCRCVIPMVLAAASAGGAELALAGAWTLDPGRGQLIFQGVGGVAPQRFDHHGRALKADRFTKSELAQSLEYGLADGVTGLFGIGFQGTQQAQPDFTQGRAAGHAQIGARYRLLQRGGFVVSVQGQGFAGFERSIPKQSAIDPRLAADGRLLAGYGFELGGLPAFAEVQAGYRWRGGPSPDELRLDATLGLRPHHRWLLMLQSFNTLGVTRDRRFHEGRVHQHKLQASAVYDLTQRWAVQIGGFATVRGRETAKERGVVTAVWLRF